MLEVLRRNGDGTFFPKLCGYFPVGWNMIDRAPDGVMLSVDNGLKVIVSGETRDGKDWVHCSFSRKSRMPNYDDISIVRRIVLGEDCKAIMVWPKKENYVNIHPFCLHLYVCLQDDGLPEFSGIVAGMRTI